MANSLLSFKPEGIYCEQAGVYLDPWRKVDKALITHAHSDHARWGNKQYLAHHDSEAILHHRLGKDLPLQTVAYNEKILINGVTFSFHPAGHIIGSSQIRVEHKGEVWVFTGDYKLENDGFSTPFESVKCHTLITESTFGLPVYKWQKQDKVFEEINAWWRNNANQGLCSVIFAYSLGKAQRILKHLDLSIGEVYAHGAVYQTNEVLQQAGFVLPELNKVPSLSTKKEYAGAMVLAPPASFDTPWMRKFEPYRTGVASGWMAVRGARRWRAADRGFVLSDHADWPSLNTAVQNSGAETVYVTHGYADTFAKWLTEKGLNAFEAKTEYTGENPVNQVDEDHMKEI